MVVSTQKQPDALLSVNRLDAGPFFFPEPGAYSIQNGLLPAGQDDNLVLTVDFPDTMIPRAGSRPRGTPTDITTRGSADIPSCDRIIWMTQFSQGAGLSGQSNREMVTRVTTFR